jgi:hypothetical protein
MQISVGPSVSLVYMYVPHINTRTKDPTRLVWPETIPALYQYQLQWRPDVIISALYQYQLKWRPDVIPALCWALLSVTISCISLPRTQPKICLGPNTRTRLIWKYTNLPGPRLVWNFEKSTQHEDKAGMFKSWYQTNTGTLNHLQQWSTFFLGTKASFTPSSPGEQQPIIAHNCFSFFANCHHLLTEEK